MSLVSYWRTRGLLGVGAVGCLLVGGLVSGAVGFPAKGVWGASLLLQPSPAVAVIAVALMWLIGTFVGTLVAGRVRPEAGIFAAALGLAGVSWRSGSMRDVLFANPNAGTYLKLGIECLLLIGVIGICQWGVRLLVGRGLLRPDEARDGVVTDAGTLKDAALATVVTAGVYALLCWFLLTTDLKQQALIGTAVAGFIAAAAVHTAVVPNAPAWSFWLGVMLAATVCAFYAASMPGLPAIGLAAVPVARALPIDHASAGVAAALLGYWYARRWRRAGDGE